MSTHATIAYRLPDGSQWVGVYNHHDGDSLGPRIERAVKEQGAQAVRDLIAATPQGFGFFDPSGSEKSIIDGEDLHNAFPARHPDTTERGFGFRHSRGWEHTYIIELDGSVTELGPVPE